MSAVQISLEQQRQFREEGFCILENGIPPDDVTMLREECQAAIDRIDAEMERAGADVIGINRRNNRYFITHPSHHSSRLHSFARGELMATLCRAMLGDTAFFAWEQFVVKGADTGARFGWHQDAAYAHSAGAINLPVGRSCWCALDDMSEENGTVYLLPYSRFGGGKLVPHTRDEELNDLIGYQGDDPGIPVLVPAGGIALFSGVAFHRSGPNVTNRMRRVYLSQYSSGVALLRDGGQLGYPEPFLVNGEPVAVDAKG
jgi:ectoine hydroxylase-related dioxygenase (phytanoyl-CoA dioxygenase family)